MTRRALLLAVLAALVAASPAAAQFIVLQSTTSTRNSGLFDRILPVFRARTGIAVRVVAVGTGQAIRNAANGDGDALLVHDREAEEKFVADGHGLARADVMYNDFVIVGPRADPARIAGIADAPAALARIARARAPFASRGDDSGTHKAELRLWRAAGIARRRSPGAGTARPAPASPASPRHLDRLRQQARPPIAVAMRGCSQYGIARQARHRQGARLLSPEGAVRVGAATTAAPTQDSDEERHSTVKSLILLDRGFRGRNVVP